MSDRLLEQIASPENLLAAWRAIRGNIPKYRRDRSAGPDRVTLTEFERDLSAQLNVLRDMLLAERYRPQPPARFTLRKRDGGQREIAVLRVVDRVAQRAAQQVIEPLWEPEFLDCSFGFRPGRSVADAVARVLERRARGYGWVVDGDIAACFDSLNHDLLMAMLKRKIHDARVQSLLQTWLDAGVMAAGLPTESEGVLAAGARRASQMLQRSMDLALKTAAQEADPYAAARYEMEARLDEFPGAPNADALTTEMRRSALRRVATSGLLLALSWARPAVSAAGSAVASVLKSPVGHRLLKKGALATGGLAGVAAGGAVAAYLLNRRAGPGPSGALQGSPLSPLLANIYLHPFDVAMTKRGHQLVRFADDWVILCKTRDDAGQAYNDAVIALHRLRLKMNREKTRIVAPGEKLEWLGVVIK